MARPKKAREDKVGTHPYSIRLTDEVAERVEHIRQSLQAQAPFVTVTMTDALRHLITEASASAVWPEGKSSRLTKIAGEDKSSSKGRKSRGKP